MALRSVVPRPRHDPSDAAQMAEHAAQAGHGSSGLLATGLSAIALMISGASYYESTMKGADLAIFVPPMIHYARDGGDVFNIPITIANDGAKAGTVLTMELTVENLRPDAERKSASFHSAFLGEHNVNREAVTRSFAPMSVPGHGTVTETIRFYNKGEALPYIVDEKGDYRFTLKMVMASAAGNGLLGGELKPLTFEMNLPYLAVQHLAFNNGTIAMVSTDWSAPNSLKGSSGSEPKSGKKSGAEPDPPKAAEPVPPETKAEATPAEPPKAAEATTPAPEPAPGPAPEPAPEAKPVESKPVESKPGDSKPAEAAKPAVPKVPEPTAKHDAAPATKPKPAKP